MLIDTIDLYHSITLSVALTDSHKFSRKETLLASFSCTLFSRLVVALQQCKLNISILMYTHFFGSRGIAVVLVVLLTALQNLNIGVHLDVYKSVSFKQGMIKDTKNTIV